MLDPLEVDILDTKLSISLVSRTKHPDEVWDAWHPCSDFLIPLMEDIGDWRRTAEATAECAENLAHILIAIVRGIGSEFAFASWMRFRAWLETDSLGVLRDAFIERTTDVYHKCEVLIRELDMYPLEDEEDDDEKCPRLGTALMSFDLQVIDPFLVDLGNWSRELQRKFPPAKSDGDKDSHSLSVPAKKKSTVKGEAQLKLVPALIMHHQYESGGCLNFEPIGSNALARMAKVSKSVASDFFRKEFGSHAKYKFRCHSDASCLATMMKRLNKDYMDRCRRPLPLDV